MTPRVAIVHDWLVQPGGAELVLRDLCSLFPEATLFTLFDHMPEARRRALALPAARTSFLQGIPGIARHYRSLLPLFPRAIQSLDLSGFDLVISSHHAVAKGVRLRPGQRHICYCHSPMRYAWEQRERYLAEHGIRGLKAVAARLVLERLRRFDLQTASRVDQFIVNSANVAGRVKRWYGRDSLVIPPPVDTEFFTPSGAREPATYVTASRFVPYKHIPMIIHAFATLPERRLVVIGDGPDREAVYGAAERAPNVTLLGEVPRERLRDEMRKAQAFVFAADEDAGIVPLEAQACGTPVIAYGAGGSLETVTPKTGIFFDRQSPAAIAEAVRRFEALRFLATDCRENAVRFSRERFLRELTAATRPERSEVRGQ